MSAAQSLLQHVHDIQSYLLSQRSVLEDQYGPVQQQQMELLGQRMEAAQLSCVRAKEFVEVIMQGPWTAAQKQRLAQAINRGVSLQTAAGNGSHRRPNQTMKGFAAFLTVKDLEVLKSKAALHIKCDCIVTRLLSLGLHLPSEARMVTQRQVAKSSTADGRAPYNCFMSHLTNVIFTITSSYHILNPLMALS